MTWYNRVMDERLTVAVVVLVALGTAGSAVPVTGGVGPPGGGPAASDADAAVAADGADTRASAPENESNGTSVGTEVSAFIESSDESTNGSVDRGMFDAEYNDSAGSGQADLVRERAGDLEERLVDLRAEKERLVENRDNMSETAYQAQMSSVVTRLHELEAAIDDTERKANETGVDTDRLDRLRNETGNVTGPEIARIARNLSSVTPGPPPGAGLSNETGPPDDDRGPPGDEERTGAPDNETGVPDDERNETTPSDDGNDGESSGEAGSGDENGTNGSDGADGGDSDGPPAQVRVVATGR